MPVSLNVNDLGNKVEELINTSKDRVAFVEDSRDKVFYELEQKYNVLVFNRQKRKNWDVPTKGQVLYRSFNYKGTTYGIWAFERAVFRYIGKNGKGAPKNLAYAGNCVVSAEDTAGTKSIVLTFELPETAKLHQVVKDDTLYNLSLKYGTTVDESVKMNADKVKDANKIYPNDVLRVRH